jgi:hypothetical protein
MELYYMLNYYFKYIEFLDTVFLALKKKPLRMFSPSRNTHASFLIVLHVTRIPPCLPSLRHSIHVLRADEWAAQCRKSCFRPPYRDFTVSLDMGNGHHQLEHTCYHVYVFALSHRLSPSELTFLLLQTITTMRPPVVPKFG